MISLIKNLIIALSILYCFQAQGQQLLGLKQKNIEKYLSENGGSISWVLHNTDIRDGQETLILKCKFDTAGLLKNEIERIDFFLKGDRCFKYTTLFFGSNYVNDLISKLESPNSGFTKVGRDFAWQNLHLNCKIYITDFGGDSKAKSRYEVNISRIN